MPATIPCPICKKEVPLNGPEMPFCSERCRVMDLANWADEKYKISEHTSAKKEFDGEAE